MIRFLNGIKVLSEFDDPTHSACVVLRQILEIGCNFQINGAPPKVMTHAHRDFAEFGSHSGSCLNIPAKSALDQQNKLCFPSGFTIVPSSAVLTGHRTMDLTAVA